MTIRILGMEESETLINEIGKFVKKSKIWQINLPSKTRDILIDHKNVRFFESNKIIEQIKAINKIKNDFDLCFVSSWSTARIAYLCDLNYIIFFVGNDIRIPPFISHSKPNYFHESVNKLNFLERKFYKKVMDNAIACVTGSEELFNYLKKYRKDAIRIDRIIVNTSIFHPNVEPINLQKNKFTFFSPQRIGVEKGTDILWKAISLCKSNFEILQVDWIDDKSPEAKQTSLELRNSRPSNIKLIKKIPREEIPKFYAFCDGVIGEMRTGHANSIEREAVLCRKPVIAFNDLNWKIRIDDRELTSPILPTSQEPEEIANLIDLVVGSKKFREELVEKEFRFMKELTDPEKAAKEWDSLFEILHKQYSSIKKGSSNFKIKIRLLFFLIAENLHFIKNDNRLNVI